MERPRKPSFTRWLTDRLNAGAARLNAASDRIDARRAKTGGYTGDGHCLDGSPIVKPGCLLCRGTGKVTFHDLTGSKPWSKPCPACYSLPAHLD